jgi:hypothetical protein
MELFNLPLGCVAIQFRTMRKWGLLRDPARTTLVGREHRKHAEPPFAGRHGLIGDAV